MQNTKRVEIITNYYIFDINSPVINLFFSTLKLHYTL